MIDLKGQGDSEREKLILEEIEFLAKQYRKVSEYRRNRGWKAKRFRAIAYGLEKAIVIIQRYGTELDLGL